MAPRRSRSERGSMVLTLPILLVSAALVIASVVGSATTIVGQRQVQRSADLTALAAAGGGVDQARRVAAANDTEIERIERQSTTDGDIAAVIVRRGSMTASAHATVR